MEFIVNYTNIVAVWFFFTHVEPLNQLNSPPFLQLLPSHFLRTFQGAQDHLFLRMRSLVREEEGGPSAEMGESLLWWLWMNHWLQQIIVNL